MSLPTEARTQAELAERDAALASMLSPDQLRVMRDTVSGLVEGGAGRGALRVGDEAPDFILPNAQGQPTRLYSQLESSSVVLVFFRGGWCPFCETYLRGLQRELFHLRELGAELIAVSPQLPDNSLQTEIDQALAFPLLSDSGLRTARRYGLAYSVPPALQRVYHQIGIDLNELNGSAGADQLPLAATFIINQSRQITLAEINEDYTKRYDPVDIIAALVDQPGT